MPKLTELLPARGQIQRLKRARICGLLGAGEGNASSTMLALPPISSRTSIISRR